MRFLDRLYPLALLGLRVVLGIILTAHGYAKVFGGMPKFIQMVQNLGLPSWMAYLAAATEFGGGILIIAGLLTRLAALAFCIEMGVAIDKVHWSHGLKGPAAVEFPLAVAIIAFALMLLGAGPISLDAVFFRGGGGPSRK